MHYCPRCGTTLANFEVAQGYKDVEDYAVTVRLPLVDKSETSLLYQGASLIALKTPAGKFRIIRDHHDRVRKVTLEGGREIELSHDELGRVVAATDSKLGKVEISYGPGGSVRALRTRARAGAKEIQDSVLRVLLDVLAAVEPQRRLNL